MKDFLSGAAGAGSQRAPTSPVRPLSERVATFVRPECGLTPLSGGFVRPSTSSSGGSCVASMVI